MCVCVCVCLSVSVSVCQVVRACLQIITVNRPVLTNNHNPLLGTLRWALIHKENTAPPVWLGVVPKTTTDLDRQCRNQGSFPRSSSCTQSLQDVIFPATEPDNCSRLSPLGSMPHHASLGWSNESLKRNLYFAVFVVFRVSDWLIDWLVDWLIDWLIDRATDWLIMSTDHRLVDRLRQRVNQSIY